MTLLAAGLPPAWAAPSGRHAPAPVLPFAQAVRLSLTRAPAITEAEGALTEAHGQHLSALAAFLPTVSASDGEQLYAPLGPQSSTVIAGTLVSTRGRFYDNAATVSAQWNLFDGGKDVAGYRAAALGLQSAEQGLESAVNTTLIKVVGAYEAVVADQIRVHLDTRIVSWDRRISDLTQKRYRHLIASRLAVLQALQQLITAQTTEINDRTQEAEDRETLARAIGLAGTQAVRVADALPAPPPIPAGARAPRSAPSVVSARAAWEAARENVRVAEAGYWPTLAVTGQYNWLGLDPGSAETAFMQTHGNNYTVGLTLSWTLFPLINTGGAVESAEGQALSAEGTYHHAEVIGRRRWQAARSLYRTARANARAAAQAVRWAHETVTLTKARVHGAQASALALAQAEVARLQALTTERVAVLAQTLTAWKLLRADAPKRFAARLLRVAQGGVRGAHR
ncbi:TolC family protein [Acidiferrobacter sp.]|uniref:TolC family protein n=1 Tax=Acidiferrobacter sp. TaxID=1872107 RepID=UPI0026204625|nr:TolC family protein [Acidiferrobacter sp.]